MARTPNNSVRVNELFLRACRIMKVLTTPLNIYLFENVYSFVRVFVCIYVVCDDPTFY